MTHARSLAVGSTVFEWGVQTYIMGVINATPDSFSGDGLMRKHGDWVEAAVRQGKQQEAAGAHILDIGGESTRPGSTRVPVEEELRRVLPVVRRLSGETRIPISIDTYKAEVARQALEAGASIVNDVSGLRMDPWMARVAAQYKAPVIIVHNRSNAKHATQEARLGGRYISVRYADPLADIVSDLQVSVNIATSAGISPNSIILDPGIGFGKTVQQNLEILCRFRELHRMRYPILAGPSRKSFIGYTLDLPPEERVEGTAAAVALLIDRGVDIVRVHDVTAMKRVTRLTDAIVRPLTRHAGSTSE
jgi:dihydropteroate synthase